MFFYLNIFSNVIYSCDEKLNFSIINLKQNSVLTWSHESVYTAQVYVYDLA